MNNYGNENEMNKSSERPSISPAVIRRLPRYFRYLRILRAYSKPLRNRGEEGNALLFSSRSYRILR